VEFDRPDLIKILLNAGANPNTPDKKGRTPLQLAQDCNDAEPLKQFSGKIRKKKH